MYIHVCASKWKTYLVIHFCIHVYLLNRTLLISILNIEFQAQPFFCFYLVVRMSKSIHVWNIWWCLHFTEGRRDTLPLHVHYHCIIILCRLLPKSSVSASSSAAVSGVTCAKDEKQVCTCTCICRVDRLLRGQIPVHGCTITFTFWYILHAHVVQSTQALSCWHI